MSQSIYLEPSKVPPQLRGGYTGKKFAVRVCESMTIPSDAGLWSGGSRDLYRVVRFADGASVTMPGQASSPWDAGRRDQTITLTPDLCVVRHSDFCGKDMGLTFYIHPSNAAPLLPPPAELTKTESLVLAYTAGRKSSYMGKDRYEMARDDAGGWRGPVPADFPTRADWDAAKAALIGRGMLNKAGAITPAGRNAAPRI
jgi:hypothetical protein